MTEIPVATPVTTPVVPMVALAGMLLLQMPPAVGSLNVIVEPTHTAGVPVMSDGSGLTVIGKVAEQPAPTE